MEMINVFNAIPLILSWWLLCLVCIGFVLTVLVGCIMIVGLFKFIGKQLRVIRIMR